MGDAREMPDNCPLIYVTGFGPFEGHPNNASKAAVDLLTEENLEDDLGVKLFTETLKVEYDYVKNTVPIRWKELKPKLVVHVGVSGKAETLILEQLAHNHEYIKPDNCGQTPPDGCCCPKGDKTLQSTLRMDLISSSLNKMTHLELACAKSTDPGRFLCDFIYYLSLNEDSTRSAFIHVPPLSRYSAKDISAAIAAAIKEMYQQVLKNDLEQSSKNEVALQENNL